METFKTPKKKDFKPKSSFEIDVESIKRRIDAAVDSGWSKYEIALDLPGQLKRKEGIEESLTRHYIRERFEK